MTKPEFAALQSMLRETEKRHALPSGLLRGIAQTESAYRVDARSSAGALGLMQFMPATAEELGIDPMDPAQAADGAARYLKRLHNSFGGWTLALAAYNWGQGNLRKAMKAGTAWPKETDDYVRKVWQAAKG